MDTVLITGATGFVGAALAERLQDSHHTHVLVRRSLDDASHRRLAGCTVHLVPSGAEQLVELVRTIAPSAVFHCAAASPVTGSAAAIPGLIEGNVTFGTLLAEALVSSHEPPSFINVGTWWQHAAPGSDAYAPRDLYAATKQAFQDVLTWYGASASLRAVTVKLFDTYGPRDARGKLVGLIAGSHGSPEPLRLSPGEQQLDLLHVDDAVRGLLCAWDHARAMPPGHESYSLASPNRVTVREVVALVATALNIQPNVELGARPYRDGEIMVPWQGDPVLPGWSATIDLPAGLATLLERTTT